MVEGGTVVDDILVLDPRTFRMLGQESVMVKAGGSFRGMRPGTIEYQEVVLQAGWTNESPYHP
jgi:hypothetical protein